MQTIATDIDKSHFDLINESRLKRSKKFRCPKEPLDLNEQIHIPAGLTRYEIISLSPSIYLSIYLSISLCRA